MVALDIVTASNARLRELGPGLVALFVGGTSGVGEFTLKAFVANSLSPRVYMVGRSASAAEKIIEECKEINKDGIVHFLKADVSELGEVDRVCKEIITKEKKINLVVQTQGNLNLRGYDPSVEGLDRKFVLNYYSRMRFIQNLLPLLRTASTESPHFSRTLSVLGAGTERSINFKDLGLKETFSVGRCASHTIVMNDFMAEELAAREPGTTFIHSTPLVVMSGVARELPLWARAIIKVTTPLLKLFAVSLEETGQRQLFHATSGMYPPAKANMFLAAGVPLSTTGSIAEGSNGQLGSGGYIVNWNGEITGKSKMMSDYRAQGVAKTIWDFTMGTFSDVEKANEGRAAKPST